MNIEKDIFKRCNVNFSRLEGYGFKKVDDYYVLERKFLDDKFNAIICIDDNGVIRGKIIDLEYGDEYLGLRNGVSGKFVDKVREAYREILIDIRDKCFNINYYIFDQSNRINQYIKNKYNDEPEFLWDRFPFYGVYRNKNNSKWYAVIMNLDMSKLDNGVGEVEIINVKLDSNKINNLLKKRGFYKSYHMNKRDWISIILNDTLSDEDIISLVDESYYLINLK